MKWEISFPLALPCSCYHAHSTQFCCPWTNFDVIYFWNLIIEKTGVVVYCRHGFSRYLIQILPGVPAVVDEVSFVIFCLSEWMLGWCLQIGHSYLLNHSLLAKALKCLMPRVEQIWRHFIMCTISHYRNYINTVFFAVCLLLEVSCLHFSTLCMILKIFIMLND